jgi:hypothetical protein
MRRLVGEGAEDDGNNRRRRRYPAEAAFVCQRVEPPSHRYGVPRDNAFHPPKKSKKSLATICGSDKNAVIELNYHPMNTNNAVFRLPIRGRSHLFRSLFLAAAGALVLTAALVPRADALPSGPIVLQPGFDPIVYFNFETAATPTVPAGLTSYTGPFNSPFSYPFLQTQTIKNGAFDGSNPFPTATSGSNQGHFGVVANTGTTDGQLAGDPTTASPNSALDLNGNTTSSLPMFCFSFGVNTAGYQFASLDFQLKSIGNGGQFDTVEVFYSPNPATTAFASAGSMAIIQDGAYHNYHFDISGATGSPNAVIEICLSGSDNSANTNHTFIDNIVVSAKVPEPTTSVSGVLAVLGLCWYRRRWLIRALRLRRA